MPDDILDVVVLRDVIERDILEFYEHQLDSTANQMAAFTSENPKDEKAHHARWRRLLTDETVKTRTIMFNGCVAGHIASFERAGERELTYWLGREQWGKGVATRALEIFLCQEVVRPLYARVANDNVASLRVLEKCGFTIWSDERGFSNARGEEVEEYVVRLDRAE